MYTIANINGVETSIEIQDWVFRPYVETNEGQTIIDHDSYLEVLGTVSTDCEVVTNGVIEGEVSVQLPEGSTYYPHATAHNITDAPADVTGENAFVAVEGTTLKVYLTAHSTSAKTMTGTYSVKVVK